MYFRATSNVFISSLRQRIGHLVNVFYAIQIQTTLYTCHAYVGRNHQQLGFEQPSHKNKNTVVFVLINFMILAEN